MFEVENSILEHNLFGVDINNESVEIAKLSLWLRTAQKGRKLTSLNNNIKCGNSLIDDPAVAGDKAFDWKKEFPQVFKEKSKQAYHITTALHDSRTSQRMIDYKVRQKRDLGTNPYPNYTKLTAPEELLITQTVAEIVAEDELNVLVYNICGDHMHLLLVCEAEEQSSIVQKIKAITAKKVNIARGVTRPPTREHAPLASQVTETETDSPREHAPLPSQHAPLPSQHAPLPSQHAPLPSQHAPLPSQHAPLPSQDAPLPMKKHNSLWTQKYGCNNITTDEQLQNTINYIQNNREKHELPENKELQTIISKLTCTIEQAFAPEYNGGFDVVIGNPPYVQSHSLDEGSKSFIYKNYKTSEYQINTYAIFIEKIINILRIDGRYSIIIPNYWLSTKFDSALRKLVFLDNKCDEVLNTYRVFEDATVDTLILTGLRENVSQFPKRTYANSINPNLKTILERLTAINGKIWERSKEITFLGLSDDTLISFESKLELKGEKTLGDYFDFKKGMQPYEKGKGIPAQTREMMNDRIYHSSVKIDDSYKPLLKSRNIQRYYLNNTSGFIKYGKNLAAPRSPNLFKGKRILINRILSRNAIDGIYLVDEYINNTDIFNLLPKNKNVNTKALFAFIVSPLCATFFKKQNINLNRSAFPKINVNTLEKFPIPHLTDEILEQLEKSIDGIISFTKSFNELIDNFTTLLQSKFPIEKLTNKLQSWHTLPFGEFLKELQKAKVSLSLSEEAEWMGYFNEQKQKAQTLQQEIDRVDGEIDAMVYGLYGLSEEEIGIVENS
ncbi:MAG: N-6 DNA methylase [Bacteroidetes bacterium]|nr:N-6 DNA methylase [Bacteroidota bacterium]